MHSIPAPLNNIFIVANAQEDAPRVHGDVRVFEAASAAMISNTLLGGTEADPTWKGDLGSVFLLDAHAFWMQFSQELLAWAEEQGVLTARHLYSVSSSSTRVVNGKEETFEVSNDYPSASEALAALGVVGIGTPEDLESHGVRVSSVFESATGQRLSNQKLEKKLTQQWAQVNGLDGVWYASRASSPMATGLLFAAALSKVTWERMDIVPAPPSLGGLLGARGPHSVDVGDTGVTVEGRVFPKPR